MPLDRMQEEIKEIASRAFNGLIRSFDFLIDLLTTTAEGVSLDYTYFLDMMNIDSSCLWGVYQVLIEARIKNLTSSSSKKLSSDDSSSEESTQTKDQVEQLERLKSIITSQT